MAYITQQRFCDMLKISKGRLRILLREHEFPVYEIKRCGRKVYDEKDAIAFVRLIEIERAASKSKRQLQKWWFTRGQKKERRK